MIAPSEEFIITRLKGVPHITKIAAATEDNDPNHQLGKQGGYTAQIYFSSPLVDPSYTNSSDIDVIEEGTSCGGSVEIYATAEDAERRNKYLASLDGGALSSGSHTVIGTVLIRTSSKLTVSNQKMLEEEIITALTSGETQNDDASSENTNTSSDATQAPEEMKAYTCSGIPYYVWNDWDGPVLNDIYSYYYKDKATPLNGMLMTMEYSLSQTLNDNDIEEGLKATAKSVGDGLGCEIKAEPMNIDSRKGLYFSGTPTSNGGYNLVGYITVKDNNVVAFLLANGTLNETALRPMLMKVLNK